LAYARHFPAIHWLGSYSEYVADMEGWYGSFYMNNRDRLLQILHEESELLEIVKLIGADALPDSRRLVLTMGRVVRVGFAQQNAYTNDAYMPYEHQLQLMALMVQVYDDCLGCIQRGVGLHELEQTGIFDRVTGCKEMPVEEWETVSTGLDYPLSP
jgi:V/A-type H+-transporting ATPase subunit A